MSTSTSPRNRGSQETPCLPEPGFFGQTPPILDIQPKKKKSKKITGAGKALALVGALPKQEPRGLACDQLRLEMFHSFLALLPLLRSQLKPGGGGQREDLTPEYASYPLQLLLQGRIGL